MRARWLSWLLAIAGCQLDLDEVPEGPSPAVSRTPSRAGKRHRTCRQAFPTAAVEPSIATDAVGRPAFDMYRDLACGSGAQRGACATATWQPAAGCEVCLLGTADGGVCVSPGAEGLDDPSVVSTQSGRCYGVVNGRAKRRACCAPQLPGIDCRQWPFDGSSGPGQLCGYHADCEPGLVCKQLPYGPGVGLAGACACPEADDEPSEHNAADCEAMP